MSLVASCSSKGVFDVSTHLHERGGFHASRIYTFCWWYHQSRLLVDSTPGQLESSCTPNCVFFKISKIPSASRPQVLTTRLIGFFSNTSISLPTSASRNRFYEAGNPPPSPPAHVNPYSLRFARLQVLRLSTPGGKRSKESVKA
jgi:hypothetical protein